MTDGKWSAGLTQDLGNVDTRDTRIHRVGVIVVREFKGRRFGVSAPKIAGSATWYVDDPSKEGTVYAWVALEFTIAKTALR